MDAKNWKFEILPHLLKKIGKQFSGFYFVYLCFILLPLHKYYYCCYYYYHCCSYQAPTARISENIREYPRISENERILVGVRWCLVFITIVNVIVIVIVIVIVSYCYCCCCFVVPLSRMIFMPSPRWSKFQNHAFDAEASRNTGTCLLQQRLPSINDSIFFWIFRPMSISRKNGG